MLLQPVDKNNCNIEAGLTIYVYNSVSNFTLHKVIAGKSDSKLLTKGAANYTFYYLQLKITFMKYFVLIIFFQSSVELVFSQNAATKSTNQLLDLAVTAGRFCGCIL